MGFMRELFYEFFFFYELLLLNLKQKDFVLKIRFQIVMRISVSVK